MKSISSQVPPVPRPATTVVLSADNRFTLMPALRQARVTLGISPQVLATLEAMLTCLPKTGTSRVVFASNATLVHRRNGISERTIRRHIARLAELGLLRRCDSPNAKRYSRRDPLSGDMLRFGLDLAPLFERAMEITQLAEQEAAREEARAFLRLRIRTSLEGQPEALRTELAATLRRKLELEELAAIADRLPTSEALKQEDSSGSADQTGASSEPADVSKMSGSDSLSVRHNQRSEEETKDKRSDRDLPTRPRLDNIKAACPFAMSFALGPVKSLQDLVQYTDMMAAIIGISSEQMHKARARNGSLATAKTILLMTEMKDRVRAVPAYFRAVTTGERASHFDPDRLLAKQLRKLEAIA